MELFERFEELNRMVETLNAEATHNGNIPYLRLHEYIHYCDVKLFLFGYTRKLCMSQEERTSLLRFCYKDTLSLKSRIGNLDLYAFTFHYLKRMTYRTGNLDTPDDCVEKLDLERFTPYRLAREAEWRGEPLPTETRSLLEQTLAEILAELDEAKG
ncbi:MAG: hypothetical protein PHI98_11745 [Eubacteriales bacterium]|nr:hypothetical protein [Eubacteriales bacterium]